MQPLRRRVYPAQTERALHGIQRGYVPRTLPVQTGAAGSGKLVLTAVFSIQYREIPVLRLNKERIGTVHINEMQKRLIPASFMRWTPVDARGHNEALIQRKRGELYADYDR